ncbi:MAG: Gfo/Idh/MocA family protein [Leptospira bouyouniensis]|uniref:Gfo/Idh/MocA family oxidoreductase n=1 Tax=Leptospira bouyouniensis TaxID=2484911 RepID=A0ABY2L4E4_9LEPT|nr:Gfo/Idh/MocA family oxidoreductase [Leptospira bouyouniensis]TGK48325.1 gfo/Idh/MocA family oxidoreductase [Leptospira bouyouniensis]TGM80710.1 gfo/Idh/MocA family oxidoreductase [Leptospira bouyouniensis]
MKPTKIKTILIGLGRIASKLEKDPYRKKPCTHMGVLMTSWGKAHFEFVSGFDSNPEACELFQNQWKQPTVNIPNGLFQKLNLPTVNLAIIATPSHTHEGIAKECIKMGIRHLLIEKPVAMSSKGAKTLEQLSKSNQTKIWINHERRYHPSYLFVRDELKKGNFGQIKSIRASVFTSAKNPGIAFSKSGGGPLLHDGTHALDLIHWLVGKPKLVHAKMERPKKGIVETRASAYFFTNSNIQITLDVSGGREYFQFELDIHTNSHRIICSNDGFQFFQSVPSKLYKGFQSLELYNPKGFPKPETSNAFLGIYKEIKEVIHGEKSTMEGTLSENIQILESIESIYRNKK